MDTNQDSLLGETDNKVAIDSRQDHSLVALMMAKQASRTLEIISRELDPVVYNNQEFVEAVKYLVLKNRKSKVRILVYEPMKIVKRGHRLVDLAMDLSSFIEFRVPNFEYADFNESIFIADTVGYIHRISSERFDGTLNFNGKRKSRTLTHQFDEIWEKAKPDPNLKRALL